MRHVGIALLLLIGLAALPAYAGPPFGCCYCTNMVVGDNALLCAALPSGDFDGFNAECQAKGGLVLCIAATSPDSCPAAFHSAGITCPQTTPAPVLSVAATAVLAALLAGLGGIALAVRRRASTPR